jgi:nitrous oxidase accessory protein NosD
MGNRIFHSVIMMIALSWPLMGMGQSLKSRIDAAKSGDTIVVQAGKYPGNLLLNRRVSLMRWGCPVIHGSGVGSTITVTADSCVGKALMGEHSGPSDAYSTVLYKIQVLRPLLP